MGRVYNLLIPSRNPPPSRSAILLLDIAWNWEKELWHPGRTCVIVNLAPQAGRKHRIINVIHEHV